MTHDQPTDETREAAMLYALGMLAPSDAAAFEAHVAGGCTSCRGELLAFGAVASTLASTPAPHEPPPSVRERLLERVRTEPRATDPARPPVQVWKDWARGGEEAPAFVLRRSSDGEWIETGVAGVRVRKLFVDPANDRVTMLVRMDPKTSYPPHRHSGVEECFVLEGSLKVGDLMMQPGDYQRADVSSLHGVQSTETGCLLLIHSSMSDELVG